MGWADGACFFIFYFMNRNVWNVIRAVSVVTCVLAAGCDDSSSTTAPQETVIPASSAAANSAGSSLENQPLSSSAMSSAVEESSSSVALPTTLCKISLVTQTGYYPMAYTIGRPWICLPLENCDVSAVNTGFPECYDGHATVEGCYSEAKAEIVENCDDDFEDSCETRNGTVYTFGRIKTSCSAILL